MPFEMLIGDLSGVNYSSYKAGDVKFKRLATARQQQVVIPMLCDRVADWFVEAGYIAGMWPVATASREWDVPAFEEADRLKEFAADLLEVRAGFATRSQKISARGYDPLTIDEETAADNARADDLGLTLDSDPRRTAKAGSVQPTDQAASASDDGQRESGARALGDLDVNELIKLARAIIESEHGAQAPPQTSHAPARKRKAS
jgi:capsid protein